MVGNVVVVVRRSGGFDWFRVLWWIVAFLFVVVAWVVVWQLIF